MSGRVRIADFGLAKLAKNLHTLRTASRQDGFTPRWVAPEVWREEEYSKEADIFSLAMVMIEVFLDDVLRESWGLLSFCADEGILWSSSIQGPFIFKRCDYHVARRASTTADAPNSHRKNMVIDPTLLGARPSLAPRNYRGLADSPHSVSPSSTIAAAHPSNRVQ